MGTEWNGKRCIKKNSLAFDVTADYRAMYIVGKLPRLLRQCAKLDLWMVVRGVATARTFAPSPPTSSGPIATNCKAAVTQYPCLWYLLSLARLYEGREGGWLTYQNFGTQHDQATPSSASSRLTSTNAIFRTTVTAPCDFLIILSLVSISRFSTFAAATRKTGEVSLR